MIAAAARTMGLSDAVLIGLPSYDLLTAHMRYQGRSNRNAMSATRRVTFPCVNQAIATEGKFAKSRPQFVLAALACSRKLGQESRRSVAVHYDTGEWKEAIRRNEEVLCIGRLAARSQR
jgi:hypothetical protein